MKWPVAQLHGFLSFFVFLIFLMQYHMSLKLPVALLLGYSQLFQLFDFFKNSLFETSCCAVARNLSFLYEYHMSLDLPVALLLGYSQLIQLFKK